MNKSFLLALPLLAAAPLIAQGGAPQLPGQVDPSRVVAGTYAVDNHHAQIQWTVNHFGFNDYFASNNRFGDASVSNRVAGL